MVSVAIVFLAPCSTRGFQFSAGEAARGLLSGADALMTNLLAANQVGRLQIGNVAYVRNNPTNTTDPTDGTTLDQYRAMQSLRALGHAGS